MNEIVARLRELYPNGASLHEPEFSGNEWVYAKECLDTGWVSSVGQFVNRFESDLAAFTGAKHAVACVNGTAALHVSLLLAGVKAGDEVLLPTLTFIATANAVKYCGAFPHFVDSEPHSMGIDPEKLSRHLSSVLSADSQGKPVNKKTGRPIRAIVPMHVLGHPGRLDELAAVCERFGIPIVEDAAESLGSYYKGKHTGNFGLLATLSFNGNKVVTTGGGGAILTNDSEIAQKAKHLTTTAKLPHAWAFEHDQVGFNYRLPNINAALGCAQLERLPERLERKRKVAERYQRIFSETKDLSFFAEPAGTKSNYWLCAILLEGARIPQRDAILDETNRTKIMLRPLWTLMHKLDPYRADFRMDLSMAEELERKTLCLPSSPQLWDVRGAIDA